MLLLTEHRDVLFSQMNNYIGVVYTSNKSPCGVFCLFVLLSKGDKLLQINDIDLQDFSPEQLAQMLVDGIPKLVSQKSQAGYL